MPSAHAEAPYAIALTAEGGVKPYTWGLASGRLPRGISLDPKTGVLSGVPAQMGNFKFTVQVVDSTEPKHAIAMRALSLVVAGPAPQITTSALPTAQAGTPFQASLSAAGGVQPYHWSIAAGALPSKLLLNADAGVLLGTPSESGQFDFTVQVSDSSSPKPQITMKALTLSVVALALQITSGGLSGGQVGMPFQATLSASGGLAPYTWTVVGVLPSGLSLNAYSGAVVGTPTQSGASTFFVQVRDSIGQTTQRSFSISIAPASAQPLAITATTLPQPVEGQAYSATLQARGGTPSYMWTVASGQLPTGLTLVPGGQIAGTPTTEGQFSFTIQVADSASPPLTASEAFSLTIADALASPALDQYGGDKSHSCAGTMKNGSAIPGATGFFYVYKDTNINHWMFCDPLGNRFWYQGVQEVSPAGFPIDLNAKYGPNLGPPTYDYMRPQVTRMKSLGFNVISAYAHIAMFPVATNGPGNPNKLPFTYLLQPALRSGARVWIHMLPPAYSGYRGGFPDVFDSRFFNYAGSGGTINNDFTGGPAALDASPWYVGTIMDDVDELTGFGNCSPSHPHLGWQAGIMPPYDGSYAEVMYTKQNWQTYLTNKYGTVGALNTAWGSSYTTLGSSATTVSSETIGTGDGSTTSFSHTFAHGVVDPVSMSVNVAGVLQANDCPWFDVGDILHSSCGIGTSGRGTLHIWGGGISRGVVAYASGGAACGAAATPCITVTFSNPPANGVAITAKYQYGGWPKATAGGTGLLDEDGTSSWYPTDYNLDSCTPGPCSTTIATDLDGFLTQIADKYFSAVSSGLRSILPHHLVIGPDPINACTRPQILAKEAQYVDVMYFAVTSLPSFGAPNGQAKTQADYNSMGIPAVVYHTQTSQPDSYFATIQGTCIVGSVWPCYQTQSARGAGYTSAVTQLFNNYKGADGYGFIVGTDWWQWYDRANEQTNFGIATLNDNLYDGQECTTVSHVNSLGITTTPEAKNFGDFVSYVKAANRIWLGP